MTLFGKVTVVVSPLIALIKDQMEHLAKLRIVAESINSKMGEKERKRVIDDLNNMVYIHYTGCPILCPIFAVLPIRKLDSNLDNLFWGFSDLSEILLDSDHVFIA